MPASLTPLAAHSEKYTCGCPASQARCRALEAELTEHSGAAAAGMQRLQDLEYELGRAWEELERAESGLQQQRMQQEMALQQAELQLAQACQVRSDGGVY